LGAAFPVSFAEAMVGFPGEARALQLSSRVTVSRETIDSVERSVRTHGCAADVSFRWLAWMPVLARLVRGRKGARYVV